MKARYYGKQYRSIMASMLAISLLCPVSQVRAGDPGELTCGNFAKLLLSIPYLLVRDAINRGKERANRSPEEQLRMDIEQLVNAVKRGNVAFVRQWLVTGVEYDGCSFSKVLDHAVKAGHIEIIKLLLADKRANSRIIQSALHTAIEGEDKRVIGVLIASGARVCDCYSLFGALSGDSSLISYLIEQGAPLLTEQQIRERHYLRYKQPKNMNVYFDTVGEYLGKRAQALCDNSSMCTDIILLNLEQQYGEIVKNNCVSKRITCMLRQPSPARGRRAHRVVKKERNYASNRQLATDSSHSTGSLFTYVTMASAVGLLSGICIAKYFFS